MQGKTQAQKNQHDRPKPILVPKEVNEQPNHDVFHDPEPNWLRML
jgi:hypothetical protein